jgi:hypothetical protein
MGIPATAMWSLYWFQGLDPRRSARGSVAMRVAGVVEAERSGSRGDFGVTATGEPATARAPDPYHRRGRYSTRFARSAGSAAVAINSRSSIHPPIVTCNWWA